MDNPATTKRRRTESEVQPNCHVISDTEEAEEADDIYSESDSDNGDGHGNLATWDTILISELKPNKYARAVSRLQGLGIAIVQDDLPYCMPTAMLAMDIPTHEVEEVAMLLTTKWVLPGCVSIGHFLPARDQIKLAIHITNKAKVAMVTTEALAKYAHCHGINFNHHHMAVSMVALGTWTLTLDNAELATRLTSLYKVILFGKELSICVWKDSFRQAKHWAYVSGILETTSRQGVVEFFRCKCGEIIDHHFGKHLDGRLALWITIQFKKANDLNKALMYNSMPLLPHKGHKCFNGKYVSVTKAKTKEEHKADLKRLTRSEVKIAARAAAQQAWQERQANKRAANTAAMAEYECNALLLAQGFPRRP